MRFHCVWTRCKGQALTIIHGLTSSASTVTTDCLKYAAVVQLECCAKKLSLVMTANCC